MAQLAAEPWFSWACRACLAGWWGPVVPNSCPKCNGHLHITGNGYGLSLKQQEEET